MKKRKIILCLKKSKMDLIECWLYSKGFHGLHTSIGFIDYSDIERWCYCVL